MLCRLFYIVSIIFLSSEIRASIPNGINFISPDTIAAPGIEKLDTLKNSNPVIVSEIIILGNSITRKQIILRELPFSLGDTLGPGTLSFNLIRARQNLQNSSLFNFVTIVPWIQDNQVIVTIRVIERWYIWPIPVFEIAETNFNTWFLTRDFRRINYGMFVNCENFRGRKEALRFKLQTGYTEQYGIQYNIPYLNRKQTLGLEATINYYRNHEIVYKTIENKRVFYADPENYVRNEFYARLIMSLRRGIYNTSFLQVKFTNASVKDTVTALSDFYFPGNLTDTRFITLSYKFRRDRRDFKPYPLKGYYFDIEAVKMGRPVLLNSSDVIYFVGALKKFWKFNEKFYFAASTKGKYSLTTRQPYYLQRGLGYHGDQIRGFEYYVIDGQSWYMGRSNLKYQLIKPAVSNFNFAKNKKFSTFHYAFYLNLFADAGYVEDNLYFRQNPLVNEFLYGYGIGLDFVTYYDQVLRFEYSINKLGERGFFINFTSPL